MYMLFMPMLLAIYAYAVGNMDVKSVDTLNYLLFHLRLGPPTFRPPLRLKFEFTVSSKRGKTKNYLGIFWFFGSWLLKNQKNLGNFWFFLFYLTQ